jgi:hypothetical protein
MVDLCGGVFDHSEELKDRLRSRPDAPTSAEASAEAVPVPASKWTLQRLQATFDWLHSYSLAGISLFVRAAGIKLRHGRPQYFSPDPAYQQKEAALFSALRHVSAFKPSLTSLLRVQAIFCATSVCKAAANWLLPYMLGLDYRFRLLMFIIGSIVPRYASQADQSTVRTINRHLQNNRFDP